VSVTQTRRLPFTDANAVFLAKVISHLLGITDENFGIAIDYPDYRN